MTVPVRLPRPDDLELIALTVKQEAEGEPFLGKVGVAHAIVNRAEWGAGTSVPDVVFRASQFSAWGTGSPTRLRLDDIPEALWRECYAAACHAVFRRELLLLDPTRGARQYLNVEATKKGRKDGTLPPWAADPHDPTKLDASLVLAVIGHHTFLKSR